MGHYDGHLTLASNQVAHEFDAILSEKADVFYGDFGRWRLCGG